MSGRVGSLCTGYGGLERGLAELFDVDLAWVSDIDKGANKILAHRYPDTPNLGDFTTVDWRKVEPVDVLCAGFPCQDVSHAGKRAGLKPGTRTGVWTNIAEAIDALRPALCVFENVRGLLSAEAHSDVEPCPWCVGDESDGSLRALGAVLGDLAERGYDCRVTGLRAADVGAPHGRARVFIVAYPEHDGLPAAALGRGAGARAGGGRLLEPQGSPADPGLTLMSTPQSRDYKGVPSDGFNLANLARDVSLLPTPRATDPAGEMSRSSDGFRPQLGEVARLLPTPAVNDMGEGKTVDAWDEWTATMQAKHGNGNGHGKSLAIEAQRLLPTPKSTNNENRQSLDRYGMNLGQALGLTPLLPTPDTMNHRDGSVLRQEQIDQGGSHALSLHHWAHKQGEQDWGDYAPAIARWETVIGRPAPAPTETGPKGSPRLSPAFVEFLMGLPEGWVTDVPGLTRNEQLKALGNGVVPQQAAAAVGWLLEQITRRGAA